MRDISRGKVLASLLLLIVNSLTACGGGSSTTTSSTTSTTLAFGLSLSASSLLSAPTSLTFCRKPTTDSLSWEAVTGAVSYNVYSQPVASLGTLENITLVCDHVADVRCEATNAGAGSTSRAFNYVVTAVDSTGKESLPSDLGIDNGCAQIEGCTHPQAVNYNPRATVYVPGSCTWRGCTDKWALNYNPGASVEDGSCKYPNPVAW